MTIPEETFLVALREIRRNVRSAKGIAMLVLFLGLGGLVTLILRAIVAGMEKSILKQAKAMPEEMIRQAKVEVLTSVWDERAADYLASCPATLLVVLKTTFVLVPLLALLVGFDSVAGEVQNRTIRYVVGRANRRSIVAGKAIGIFAIVAAMTFLLHATVWGFAIAQGGGFGETISWGIRLWFFSAIDAAAYVGLAALVSASVRTPAVALFAGIAALVALAIVGAVFSRMAPPLGYLLPGAYESWLLGGDVTHAGGGIVALVAWGALCVFGATELVRRRDV